MTALMIVLCSIVYVALALLSAACWHAYSGWFNESGWADRDDSDGHFYAAAVGFLSFFWPAQIVGWFVSGLAWVVGMGTSRIILSASRVLREREKAKHSDRFYSLAEVEEMKKHRSYGRFPAVGSRKTQ